MCKYFIFYPVGFTFTKVVGVYHACPLNANPKYTLLLPPTSGIYTQSIF